MLQNFFLQCSLTPVFSKSLYTENNGIHKMYNNATADYLGVIILLGEMTGWQHFEQVRYKNIMCTQCKSSSCVPSLSDYTLTLLEGQEIYGDECTFLITFWCTQVKKVQQTFCIRGIVTDLDVYSPSIECMACPNSWNRLSSC